MRWQVYGLQSTNERLRVNQQSLSLHRKAGSEVWILLTVRLASQWLDIQQEPVVTLALDKHSSCNHRFNIIRTELPTDSCSRDCSYIIVTKALDLHLNIRGNCVATLFS